MATTALTGTVGNTILVKSFQADAYGGTSNTAVTWSSSAPTVASVAKVYNTNDGVIYCLTAGSATITATMGTVSVTMAVTVNAAGTFDGYSLTIKADQSLQPVNKTTQTKTS